MPFCWFCHEAAQILSMQTIRQHLIELIFNILTGKLYRPPVAKECKEIPERLISNLLTLNMKHRQRNSKCGHLLIWR